MFLFVDEYEVERDGNEHFATVASEVEEVRLQRFSHTLMKFESDEWLPSI
jgi:hypothetical protein